MYTWNEANVLGAHIRNFVDVWGLYLHSEKFLKRPLKNIWVLQLSSQCTLHTGVVEGAPAVVVVVEEAWLLLELVYGCVGGVIVRTGHIAVVIRAGEERLSPDVS